MTSPANQQNNPATNTSGNTAPSYASAVGAPKKPVVAPGSQPPVVVGASSSAQNAKGSSSTPVNGKPAVTPAVPAVARGTSSVNGSSAADHSRKSSVTMAANGPNSFVPNGGPVGGTKAGIQFGFSSPSVGHSTPQTGSAAPIPIPGTGNPRVPSPAHSPSPIPQPSASGGRPPSGLQQPSGPMTFGSLGSDGDRHMRQGSVPTNQQSASHFRRESGHSVQSDNPGGHGRGNFGSQGGRGRGGFNPHASNYNHQMGYPPNNQFRNGPGQGRSMPPPFQPSPRNMPYPNSPHQPNRSPAPVPSMPNTPNMPAANMQTNMPMQTPPQYHYPPPMGPAHQPVQLPPFSQKSFPKSANMSKARREHSRLSGPLRQSDSAHDWHGHAFNQQSHKIQRGSDERWREHDSPHLRPESQNHAGSPQEHNLSFEKPLGSQRFDLSPENGFYDYMLTFKRQAYGFPPVDTFGRPPYQPYNMGYMAPPPAGSPGYSAGFVPNPYQQSHSMSRTPSQTERPSSTTPQTQPVIVSSTPQSQNATPQAGSNNFIKPGRKSAAITIKNAAGEVIDTASFTKAPTSPAHSQAKDSPIVSSNPTPPPKSSTPSHGRTDSRPVAKTAKEIQDELKRKIEQATASQSAAEDKPKDEEPAKATEQQVDKPAAAEQASEPAAAPKAEAEKAKPAEPTPVDEKPVEQKLAKEKPAEEKPVEEKPVEEKPVEEKPAEEKPAEQPAITKEAEKPAEPAEPAEPAQKKEETEEEEMERMIREMEEADAERERKEAEHQKKREAEKAAAKINNEEQRKKNASDSDRRLREQEREMERLEEEKERQRKQGETSGKTLSVVEALAQARSAKEADASRVDSFASKLASTKIGEKPSSPADGKPTTAEKRGAKPAALNLAPLKTSAVEPPQPSAALQSLKSARFLKVIEQDIYPTGIHSPNPALNAAVAKKGKTFKYDANFLLQFQKVFTEQPSLEFHQQVKSLIGDDGGRSASSSRAQTSAVRQNSRGGAGFPAMGSFGAGGGALPPGTSSKDRFAMSNGTMARPHTNPIASFQRPGSAFPPSTSMSRTSSQANLPNSPRQQSARSTRGSRRGGDYGNSQKEAQAAKTMPLTAGQELKPIAVSAGGWKPTSIGKGASAAAATPSGYLDPEMVQRKVKAALNKMTPEKFDKIADQILTIASQSKDESDGRTLRQVIQLTFEKATDEAHWASMYARFCKRMLETMSPDVRDERIKDKNGNIVSGGNLFRKYLLNRCQEEFERGWTMNLPEAPKEEEGGDKKTAEAAMLSDEYYTAAAAKRRGLGLVQFIGELYKLGMLTERIMHECVHKLVDYKGVPDEAEIESLSKLLRTIGANLDATEKGRPMMDAYFQRINNMAELPELPSRLKFMLMDVLDLRRKNWHSKEANKGPKTLEEVRAEAEAAQAAKAQENARGGSQRGGGGRMPAGRGDARGFSSSYAQQTSNQVAMDDLRRLKGSANRTSSGNVSLGPTSMFSSRNNSNSGRRLGPGGSLGRAGDDSGASSRTGTPPVRDSSHSNAFSLLATMETEHPASPPSTSASPALSKAVIDSDKKDGE